MLKALIINDPFTDVVVDNSSIPDNIDITNLKLVINETIETECLYILEEKLFDFKYVSKILGTYVKVNKFDLVIFPATKYMKMLAARVAIKLDVGLVADVIAVERKKDDIVLSRPAFEDKIVAKIKVASKPVLFTSRMLVAGEGDNRIDISVISIADIQIEDTLQPYKIESFDLVFGCGFGFGDNYQLFDELQEKLEFGIATTKKVTEQGWMEYSHQVGLSGKIIKPKIYIALGIEGTIHHIVGMQESEIIISVNTNPNAAINSIADYYINQDCITFLNQLIAELD